MVAEKYSASMDDALIADVRADAQATGATLSSWLADAAADKLRLKALRQIVKDWESEHGAITDAELADLDRKIVDARRLVADPARPARATINAAS